MLRLSVLALAGVFSLASSQTIDQIISSSAESSHAMDFIHSEDTVLVEMDMKFTREEWENIQRKNRTGRTGREKRNALRDLRRRWKNKEIPYIVSNTFSQADMVQVNAAFADWQKYTCLRFRKANSRDRNKLVIQNGGGCASYVGMQNGAQTVDLARGCRKKGVIIHELGHAIGFHHEQTRPDRDRHVTIYKRNIRRDAQFNFQLYTWDVIKSYGVPYDYTSVMHYGQYAFSTNGQPTIKTKDRSKQHLIGNRQGHSFYDVKLANLMYGCSSHCRSPPKCPGIDAFVGKDCKCWCPGNPVKLCSTSGEGGGGTGGNAGTKPKQVCSDNHPNCAVWAARGECRQNPAFMYENCKRSCDRCDADRNGKPVQPKPCVDSSRYCERWAGFGLCKSGIFKNYMRLYCKKSCRLCPSSVSRANGASDPAGEGCADTRISCKRWARRGECRKRPKLMARYCKETCGLC